MIVLGTESFPWPALEAIGTCIGAIGTLAAFFVVFYQAGLLDFVLGPKLKVVRCGQPPLFQEILRPEETRANQMPFQIRLKVLNDGFSSAKNVSLLLGSAERIEGNKRKETRSFVPARQNWTRTNGPVRDFISPRSFALCDFAQIHPSITSASDYEQNLQPIFEGKGGLIFAALDQEAIPRNQGNVFGLGCYQFEFEIHDESGLCGSGALQFRIGFGHANDGDGMPDIDIRIEHDKSRRMS